MVPWRVGGCPVLLCGTEGQEDAPGWAQPVPARLPHHVPPPLRLAGASLAPCPCHGANSSLWGPKPSQGCRDTEPSEVGAGTGGPTPGRLLTPRKDPGVRDQSRKQEPAAAVGPVEPGQGLLGSNQRGAGAPRGPGPTMQALGQLLLVLVVGSASGHGDPRDTLACSQVGW